MAQHSRAKRLTAKEASQGTRPVAMVWVLAISTILAAVVLFLILVTG